MNEPIEVRQTEQGVKSSNGFAIAGMILGIASVLLSTIGIVPILALVFSSIGLARTKDRGGRGKVAARIGLVLGFLYTLVYMAHYGHI